MVVCARENGRKEGGLHMWRPKVALQRWARDPFPPFALKVRQPGVGTLLPVWTKRDISGHKRLLPRHCASSVRRNKHGAQAKMHCNHHALQTDLSREKLRCPPRARRARPAKVCWVASRRNVAHATTPRCQHLWALAALILARDSTCPASPCTAHHLRPTSATQLTR